ncbi:hypothetical protein EV401DRAFT_1900473 [Pisolithus croceorrhizus]|nr:hypothetical protein EV401DRAFT_1900473 [Pisolithus croceorrhizus]
MSCSRHGPLNISERSANLSYFMGLTRCGASPDDSCSWYALEKVILMCSNRSTLRVCRISLISPSILCLSSAYRRGASNLPPPKTWHRLRNRCSSILGRASDSAVVICRPPLNRLHLITELTHDSLGGCTRRPSSSAVPTDSISLVVLVSIT